MSNTKVSSEQIIDNVALGGNPTTTTQSASDNSTKVATTAYVTTAVNNLIDSSPSALNTLNELAAALNDDANFSTTVTNSIAAKLPLAGGTMSGALNMGSQNITNAGTIASGVHTITNNGTSGDTRQFLIDGEEASYDFRSNSTSGYTTTFNMDDSGLDIGHNSASRTLSLKTNSTDRLVISGGGGVSFENNNLTSVGTISSGAITSTSSVDAITFKINGAQGSDGQVLTSTGSGVAWETPSSFNPDQAQTFNDSGADVDFRVESDTNTHALFINGGNNSVGINSSSPDGALSVNGTATSGDMIARFQHTVNDNNVKGIRLNAPNSSGTQAYADIVVDPETGNLGLNAGTSSGNLAIGKGDLDEASIVITNPTDQAIEFNPGLSHTRFQVREGFAIGAPADMNVQFRRFAYSASAFHNPTKNIITFNRSGANTYAQACVYAKVRQMGLSVNRAVIAEGFITMEKDASASSWDVDYATNTNGSMSYSSSVNDFWPVARIGTSVVPEWSTSASGDQITVSILCKRSTNYDRYIIEVEMFSHQGMSFTWLI